MTAGVAAEQPAALVMRYAQMVKRERFLAERVLRMLRADVDSFQAGNGTAEMAAGYWIDYAELMSMLFSAERDEHYLAAYNLLHGVHAYAVRFLASLAVENGLNSSTRESVRGLD
jgi:hypothetical protein